MNIDEIRELIALFNQSDVAEMEVQRGDNRVRLKRAASTNEYQITAPAPPSQAAVYSSPASQAAASFGSPYGAAAAPALAVDTSEKHELIKSPIVGTYFDAASPGAAPFVSVGDTVERGQVLCIIESMKLMNEIEAETSGIVVTKLVENGRPVEYGQALFAIKPR